MSEDDDIKGPVILWLKHAYDWSPTSFDTVREALEADNYGNPFIITKRVDYEVVEKPSLGWSA